MLYNKLRNIPEFLWRNLWPTFEVYLTKLELKSGIISIIETFLMFTFSKSTLNKLGIAKLMLSYYLVIIESLYKKYMMKYYKQVLWNHKQH
jgi:hypothetical protein